MPYFKREPIVDAVPRPNVTAFPRVARRASASPISTPASQASARLASARLASASTASASTERAPDAPARGIVARASAVLDRVAGGESKASLPWAWHPKLDAGGSPVEALQSAARAFLSSLGLPIGSALPPNHAGVDGGAGEDDVPVLPARAGAPASEACIPLRIANDDAAAASLAFVSTGLVAPTGDSLPLRSVTFAPPLLTVPGGGQAVVEIRVAIPEATRPGKYSGLVTSTGGDPVRAVVIVEVT